jgi:hypothetical protein
MHKGNKTSKQIENKLKTLNLNLDSCHKIETGSLPKRYFACHAKLHKKL